uniref:F-box domain-containing protein n=2 Tax=Oryza TaxID=4527 RepID=A0A0E0RJS4_ORYRU
MMKRKEISSDQSDVDPDEVVAVAGDDRLSSLPDDLICRILSFLPTREAALTSQLSRRWRRVWPADVAALNLDWTCRCASYSPLSPAAREALLRFPTTGIPSFSLEIDHYINVAADGW